MTIKTPKRYKRGFTLVELVIVIAVIAILAAVLIPTFTNLIESANNSADTQLVANMNTVLSTDVYANQTATGTNLRKLLKDNGIDDLTTRNKDNIIVYNQVKNRFEKINLKEVKIQTEDEQKNKSLMADDETPTLTIDPNPFSFDEIFQGYTIVSTGGNDLSEAIFEFYNFRFDLGVDNNMFSILQNDFKTLWDNARNIKIGDKTDEVIAGFRNLLNKSVFADYSVHNDDGWTRTYTGIAFVQIDETSNQISHVAVLNRSAGYAYLDGDSKDETEWSKVSTSDRTITVVDNKIKVSPANVFIPETAKELSFYTFANFTSAVVVIPDTVENVAVSGAPDLTGVMFLGNTDVLFNAAGVDPNMYGAQVSSMHIQDIKESVKTFGAAVAQSELYISADEKNHDKLYYYDDLQKALEVAGNSAQVTGLPRRVIIADKEFKIEKDTAEESKTITVPANVTLHVPYGLADGKFQTGQGEGEKQTLVDDELRDVKDYDYKYKNESEYKQCTLIIGEGVNLAVNGTLEVGAELRRIVLTDDTDITDLGYVSCIAGNYGQITNNGTITVAKGGRLNACGYVKCGDSGKVIVEQGAVAYEPIVITDVTNPLTIYDLVTIYKNFPFMRYALPNITRLEIKYGGLLSVMNLGVLVGGKGSEGYFVGNADEEAQGGLLSLGKGDTEDKNGSVVIEYKYEHEYAVIDSQNSNNYLVGDIGINTVTLKGTVKTGIVMNFGENLQKTILSFIPYNFNYVISSGCTFTVTNRYAALPGAKVTVKSGGTLCVANGGEFYVADNYNSDGTKALDGKSYPSSGLLGDLYTAGGVYLEENATFEAQAGAKVGGTIHVVKGSKFVIDENANLKGEFTIGATFDNSLTVGNNKQEYTGETALPLKYKKGEEDAKLVSSETKEIS